ncbi:hypothetical protein P152DRAFT_508314 [Eremomyces bilateralis CBS 781.70]|uniref:ER membrane protein complex subunit 7 beta-sandwich domain-containing protein n=1 Tax=Eremomyces bilateralis CBS 781.70 TaxID=1392243 RepID=A0A6G1FYY1_9PEZI|nr:uncharacterized protein P152DRAFT_508314 [Eremomyces bilateralis CBS 781.70]KAF1810994.1 hypothetical protein P152DRAFT_508314 [Eremomyces bilateralis CBS 781.70]
MQFFTLLASIIPLSVASRLAISIPASAQIPQPASLSSSTYAILHSSGPSLTAPLTSRNTFEFGSLEPGSYLLSVYCRDYAFEPLRVDVSGEADEETVQVWQTFRGNAWDNKGELRGAGKDVTVDIRALGSNEYYQSRGGFSLLSFFKNPMILMSLFSLLVIGGLPWIMNNMDPETKAEFEAMQKQRREKPASSPSDTASQIQNFDMAGWLAGSSKDKRG